MLEDPGVAVKDLYTQAWESVKQSWRGGGIASAGGGRGLDAVFRISGCS
jgi:hypothetical protein